MKTIQNQMTLPFVLAFSYIGFAQDSTFNLRREIQLNNNDKEVKLLLQTLSVQN
ncbi:hypothetical protein [uncultured Winogradskyella sp.]|uniref:hypothetical protein n=1 Tax=uncultured Winogradskyella sp. TaxID=395353 RepID=UPI003513BDDF